MGTMMTPSTMTTTLLTLGAVATLAAQAPDRSHPPVAGPPPPLALPALQTRTLSNGLRVVFMEKPGPPLIQIEVLIRAGSVHEPPDKTGLASMTAAMLDEGAGPRTALELADAIDFLGASVRVSADHHSTRVALHTPLSRLGDALPLLADIILRPTFPAGELDRQRATRLTTLTQWHDEPRAIATVLFDRLLYEDHPYGRPTLGTEADLRGFTVSDLREFYTTYYRPNNATVIAVGPVDFAEVVARIESALGAWTPGDVPERHWPVVHQVRQREIFLVDKPGAAQSEIRIGMVGVPRLTDDYEALTVLNTILGGSFASRLNQKLREEKQYSYGARSRFSFRPLPGPFIASAAVQTAVTDSALSDFMFELRDIHGPVSSEELTRAKNYVALRYPGRFQSVAQIADQLEEIVTYDLPQSHFNDFVRDILAVSSTDVEQTAGRYLDPNRMAVVVVGDRAAIETGIRGLHLGPVHTMTVQDVLGPLPQTSGQDERQTPR